MHTGRLHLDDVQQRTAPVLAVYAISFRFLTPLCASDQFDNIDFSCERSLYVNDGRIGIGLCIRHFIIQISRRPTSPSARSPAWLYLGLLRVDRSALCIRYRLAKPQRDNEGLLASGPH